MVSSLSDATRKMQCCVFCDFNKQFQNFYKLFIFHTLYACKAELRYKFMAKVSFCATW